MSYGDKNGLQAQLLFYALGVGFLLGLLYAVQMAFRRLFRHSVILTAVEDVLFCLAAAFITFVFLLEYNNGNVRVYLILSEIVGLLAVRTAAAKIIVKSPKKGCKRFRR